jgi:hypothetical protein
VGAANVSTNLAQADFLTPAEFHRGPDLLRPGKLTGKQVDPAVTAARDGAPVNTNSLRIPAPHPQGCPTKPSRKPSGSPRKPSGSPWGIGGAVGGILGLLAVVPRSRLVCL